MNIGNIFLTLTRTLLFQKANRMHNCLKVHYSPAPARVTYTYLAVFTYTVHSTPFRFFWVRQSGAVC